METVGCELCGEMSSDVVIRQRDLTHHITSEDFTVVRCRVCGLLYLNPRPGAAEIGRYYPTEYFPAVDPVTAPLVGRFKRLSRTVKRWIMEDFYGYPSPYSLRWRRLRKLLLWPERIKRALRRRDIVPWKGRGRLLDVGCGTGNNLRAFSEQGWRVHGLDMSEVAVRRARLQFGRRVRHGNLDSVIYPDGAFDVILFSHSLEHMHAPLSMLQEVKRILSDEGLLIIALPNAGSWECRLFGRWWFPWELPRHLYHFEKKTLEGMLSRAGFRVTGTRTGIGSLYFMASLDRLWTHAFGRSVPVKRLLEKTCVRPLCWLAGHLGYGTEITVYAMKTWSAGERKKEDTCVAAAE